MNRYLVATLAACVLIMWGGWQKIKGQSAALQVAGEQIQTMERAAESRRNTQKLLAQLDTEHTKALTDAQAQNADLLARIGTGAQRLSVPARCPAATVRATTSPARVDDAEERAELDPAAAQRIVATATDGDEAIIALTGLQDYVRTVCLKGN